MTVQFHETLILDGEETSMAFCPPLPENHPRIIELSDEEARKQEIDSFVLSSEACWRQYIGTWMVQDKKFYLVSLYGKYKTIGDEPIFADWFTGVLLVPKGEALPYFYMDIPSFTPAFEQEIHIKIEKGIVTASRFIDSQGKGRSEWKSFIKNLPWFENHHPYDENL